VLAESCSTEAYEALKHLDFQSHFGERPGGRTIRLFGDRSKSKTDLYGSLLRFTEETRGSKSSRGLFVGRPFEAVLVDFQRPNLRFQRRPRGS
jgi:hypothetical protein